MLATHTLLNTDPTLIAMSVQPTILNTQGNIHSLYIQQLLLTLEVQLSHTAQCLFKGDTYRLQIEQYLKDSVVSINLIISY